jgi:hypothetical protein
LFFWCSVRFVFSLGRGFRHRMATHGQARERERQAKPRDCDNDRNSNDRRNETRLLS